MTDVDREVIDLVCLLACGLFNYYIYCILLAALFNFYNYARQVGFNHREYHPVKSKLRNNNKEIYDCQCKRDWKYLGYGAIH
jgi:hypothetical protein